MKIQKNHLSYRRSRFFALNTYYFNFFSFKPRDFGEYLRKQLKNSLRAGSITTENEGADTIERRFQALERICNNVHFNKYPRTRTSSACGVTAEDCTALLSEQTIQHLEAESKKGYLARFLKK